MNHEETSVLKDSIMKLRSSFKPNHPLQYVINTIEQGFLAITDRANSQDQFAKQYDSHLLYVPTKSLYSNASNFMMTHPSSSSSSSTTSISKDDPNINTHSNQYSPTGFVFPLNTIQTNTNQMRLQTIQQPNSITDSIIKKQSTNSLNKCKST